MSLRGYASAEMKLITPEPLASRKCPNTERF